MKTERVFTSAPWEKKVGYCRAIKKGNQIAVTGTVAVHENGQPHAPGDPYAQARRALEIMERALNELGANRQDVLRTRMFVTDIRLWREFGKAHGEFFADHPPATSMVEVKGLIDPGFLIEIEADAIAND